MKIFLRFAFACFLFSICGNAQAAKLYWVGGSGNFNDPAHWSYESGGLGGAKTPGSADDVFFDDNSFTGPSVINFIGNAEVHDLTFTKYAGKVTFMGLQNETIVVGGDFILNSYIDNQFAGNIRFVSTQPAAEIYFSLATCKGNVYFDSNTNWTLRGNVITDDNSSVYLKQGSFNLTDAGIYTGNLFVSNGVTLNTQNTNLKARNKFVIPSGVTLNDGGQTRVSAYIKDPTKYQVAPAISFNNARYGNLNSVMSCSVINTANTNPTCSGACDGTMTFTVPVACTSNPVYAVWSTGGSCTAIPTGTIAAGATYTVGGICGCGTQYSVIFTNDPTTQDSTYEQFNISIADPIPAKVNTFTLIQPSCFGYCDGAVAANLNTFGQLPILSNWTSSTFTGTITHTITTLGKKDTLKNSCAGTYTVQLVDANGCVSTPSVTTLGQPTQVVATPTSASLACNGICTGSITETVVGGTPGAGYTYTWTAAVTVTSTTNTSTNSNLCAGTYTFITADSKNCRDTNTVLIVEPPPITFLKVPPTGSVNIACNNTCDGVVGVNTVAGGSAPYTYSWAPAGGSVSNTATSSTYSGLCGSPAGTTYTCTITDANSCTVTTTFTVTSPTPLSNTITATQPLCVSGQGSAVGSATVTESGGVGPYTFTWTPAGGTQNGPGINPNIYTNLPPNTYTVEITDFNGCLDTATITITAPIAVTGTITTTIDPTCPTLANGQLCVTAGGGTGVYTYTWSPIGGNANCTPSTLTVTPSSTSSYTVIVSDANTCTVSVVGTLTAPPQATVTAAITHPPCAGTCNGTATLTPSGGTGPFTYQWSCSASVTNTISGQCGGTTCNYTVTDVGTSCLNTGSVSFTVAPTLSVSISATALPCSYSCNSIITSTVGGGTPGYTFSWTGTGANPVCVTCPTQTNMCAGSYTCQVTDNLGCVQSATIAISGPPVLSNTVSVTNPPCTAGQGATVGSATVTAGGGVAGYTFVWTPTVTVGGASPVTTGSGMAAGTYSVFITDFNGCLDTAIVTLTPPTAVSGTITTTTNPTCPNLNNGQLCVTAGGGNGVYTYTWSPIGGNASCSAATLTVTAGGTSVYTVTVSDALSCTVAVTGTLTSPPQATVTSAVTNPTCGSNPCTGSATLTPTGGTGPFNYAWSCSASVTNTISNQCPNTSCNYTVTDVATNCVYTGTVSFGPAPPTLTVSISATALGCASDCNSVITSTVNGGTSPYTYSWTGTGANAVCAACPSQINMCVGDYTLQVTDSLGCVQSATVSITSPPALTLTLAPTQPLCSSSCDGSILATISGGTGPYPCVNWSPSIAPNPPGSLNPTGLCGSPAGTTYTLIICDNNGCQDTATATLIAPSSVTVSVFTSSVTCSGLCNGTATATVSGGTPPYSYSWDNGAFSPSATVSGLCAGSHTLVTLDTNGCSGTTVIFNIAGPFPISANVINIQNTCGPCSGSAEASVTGGTPPYTYTWSPVGGNDTTATGLCIGNYTLSVGDANGCPPDFATFTISPIVVITLSATSQSVSCNNACDGIVSATASAGASPYTMVWTESTTDTVVGSCVTVATCSVGGLCPGTYVITATDQNGCINSDSVTIGNPPLLTAVDSQTNATCFGQCTGSATVTPAGGTIPYTVNWSTGASGTTVSNLCPGPYTYTVIDNRGCTVVQSFTITSGSQLSYTNTTTTPIACAGANGSIEVTASGGSPAYTFSWLPVGGTVTTVSPTSTLTGIPAGVYTVTITDVNGCDTTVQITLSDPGSPTITATANPETCFGACDGSATVTAVGTNPVTLTWPGGTPTGPSPIVATSLCASGSPYAVQATDGNGCNAFQNVTITGPTQIDDGVPNIVQPNCSAGGSITVSPTGGSGAGYTFCWDPSPGCAQTTNPATGLAAGVHTLVITDGSGCSQTFTYTLTTTTLPSVTVTPTNTQCSYTSDGSATAVVSGGTPAYSYTWTNTSGTVASGVNFSNVSNLPADSYTVFITDNGGCSTQQTFTISNATDILANFGKNDNLCNTLCTGSATVAPTGGTGTYTVNWSPGAFSGTTVSGLCPQNYTVIVTDGNGCMDTTAFAIVAPPALTVTTTGTDPLCNLGTNGTGTVTIGGGTPGYTITWNPNICPNCTTVTNLDAGSYNVNVVDTNGCSQAAVLVIGEPTAISGISTVIPPLCAGNCNGSIAVATSGGVGPYTYNWNLAGTVTSTADSTNNSNLCASASNYTLITNDANGCADTVTFTLNDPTPVGATASATSATCGQNNGSITITGVTGTGTITVVWINPATCGSSLTCSNLGFGVYSFEVTDQNGCKDTSYVPVTNPTGPEIDSVVVHNSCFGGANGSITVTVVNGINFTTPYTFSWTPPGFTVTTTTNSSTYSGLTSAGGPYISTVVDSLGCGTATTFNITDPTQIQDNGNFTNATCQGINDGTISSVGSGGTPSVTGYTYTLDGTTTNTTGVFVGLSVGTHTVCISDSVGCQQCFPYNIGGNTVILSQVSSTDINCNGNCNGTATLSNVNGGAAPYVISWNDPNAQSGVIASNLCPGSYTATIVDTNGCQAVQSVTISEPTQLAVSALTTDPTCGRCDGTLAVTASGGTPSVLNGYTYLWSPNSDTTPGLINVCAGVYQVNITDSLGCQQSFQMGVSNAGAPTDTVVSTSPVCGGACTGSATVTPSGGTPPYTYSWPSVPGDIDSSISNQCAGLYFVQVQDSLGCIATDSVQITQGIVLTVSTSMTNPPCMSCTGVIAASVSGGGGAYSYNWMPGALSNDTISLLCAGIYTLTVTDVASGCQDTSIIGLNNNTNGPTLTFATTDVLCNGDCNGTATVTATNGNPGYTYQWNTTPVQTTAAISGLCSTALPYAVVVTDTNGCIQTGQVTISAPNPLIASASIVTQPRCNNDCNGSIITVVSGGTPNYSYAWNPSSITGSAGSNLCAGNYSLTVTDTNGCSISLFDTLINPTLLTITGTVVPASCNNLADGAINTTTSGGTPSLTAPGYTWQWSGGSTATTSNLSNILIGNYTVVVMDSKNCTDTANFTVVSTITVTVNAGSDTTACSIGQLVLNGTVSPGTTVQWIQLPNPPLTVVGNTATVTVTPPVDTTQYVLIGQNGGCTISDTMTVISDVSPVPDAGVAVSIFPGFTVTLGGAPTSSGGTIYWTPSAGMSDSTVANPVVTPSVTTTYTVYETNANGCIGFDTITITILPEFVIPNGFSPNGDGYNDVWQIDMISLFPDCEVEVFNRWGEPLFYSKGYNTPWNGTYKGKHVPIGTYYYLIRLHDKEKKFPDHYTGPLTILR